MTYKEQIQTIVDVENEVLINTDDSIIKACEENVEFLEALLSKDIWNIKDEAADAVINTLCATLRTCGTIPSEYDFFGQWDIVQNTINHWKWIWAIQTARRRYTRQEKSITHDEIMSLTKKYVEGAITTAKQFDQSITLDSLIEHSMWKIMGRMQQYLPAIDLNVYIRDDKDFKPWITFKDISPLLASPEAANHVCQILAQKARNADVIIWLDARGFYFWWIVANILWIPFVMARKEGKLPGALYTTSYEKEYWTDTLTIQKNAIKPWQKIAIIDDLLATWWTAWACEELIKEAQWTIEWNYFVIELDGLHWRDKLSGKSESILHY